MNNKIYFFVFLFSFIVLSLSSVSAVAEISGLPDIQLDFDDFIGIDISDFASGYDDDSTTISFTNPETGAGVVLFGDTGGEHCNDYFCITLYTTGSIQIISYDQELSEQRFTVSVGNNYQTQDGDIFYMDITEDGDAPQQIQSLANQNLYTSGYLQIDMNGVFSNYDEIEISYQDDGIGDVVTLSRVKGSVTQVTSEGDVKASLRSTANNIYLELWSLGNDFSETITITASNDFGDEATTFVLTTSSTPGTAPETDYEYSSYFSTSSYSNDPHTIFYNGSVLFIVDPSDDKVYTVSTTGTYIDEFSTLASGNSYPYGIWANSSNIYITDAQDDIVYRYSSTGTYQTSFDISSNTGGLRGIWSDGVNFWVIDGDNDQIDKYTLGFSYVSSFSTSSFGSEAPFGLWSNGTIFYVSDTIDDKVYTVSTTGTYIDGFSTSSYISSPYGLSGNSTSLFIVSLTQERVAILLKTGDLQGEQDDPLQIASIAPINMGYQSNYTLDFGQYFIGHEEITLYIEGLGTLSKSQFECGTDSISNSVMTLSITSNCQSPLYFTATITSNDVSFEGELEITASRDLLSDEATVPLTISRLSSGDSQNFIELVVYYMSSWYPDSEDLTLIERMAYVFFSLVIVTGILLVLGAMQRCIKLTLWIAVILDIALFGFFLAIGYIPIGLLIVAILMFVGFLWLSRGGSA